MVSRCASIETQEVAKIMDRVTGGSKISAGLKSVEQALHQMSRERTKN